MVFAENVLADTIYRITNCITYRGTTKRSVVATVPGHTELHREEIVWPIISSAREFADNQKCYENYYDKKIVPVGDNIVTTIYIRYSGKSYYGKLVDIFSSPDLQKHYYSSLKGECEIAAQTTPYKPGTISDNIVVYTNAYINYVQDDYKKNQICQEKENQEMLVKKAKEKIINAFLKKHRVQEQVSSDVLVANPFVYEGKVIGIKIYFYTMESATEALFQVSLGSPFIRVSGIPKGLFREKGVGVLLAAKVIGKHEGFPHLQFVGVHFDE